MRYILSIIVIIFTINANAYELYVNRFGMETSWPEGEITVTLDSSLEEINAYNIVEESFLEWLDYIDRDITINFVYEDCSPGKNCIKYINDYHPKIKTISGICSWNSNNIGDIYAASITLYKESEKTLKRTILHETGHFFGMDHSENTEAIMYKDTNGIQKLQQDDINGIMSLYGEEIYPSIEKETKEKEKHFSFNGHSCSINTISPSKSIWSLLF